MPGTDEEIEKRKAMITDDPSLGLRWSVVESLPVSEPIKLGEGELEPLFDNYRYIIGPIAVVLIASLVLSGLYYKLISSFNSIYLVPM